MLWLKCSNFMAVSRYYAIVFNQTQQNAVTEDFSVPSQLAEKNVSKMAYYVSIGA